MPQDPAGELFAPGACTEVADAADKAGASAPPPDAQPVPKEPSAREVAASDQMTEAAKKHGVMWARVKGFPHWPVRARLSLRLTYPSQHDQTFCCVLCGTLNACQVLALQSWPLCAHLCKNLDLRSRTLFVQHFSIARCAPRIPHQSCRVTATCGLIWYLIQKGAKLSSSA